MFYFLLSIRVLEFSAFRDVGIVGALLQAFAGIKNPEKRPTPLFLNRISVLQYKKELLFLTSKIPNYSPQILNASASKCPCNCL